MTFDEIKKQYPHEWVLVEYWQLDDQMHVKEGNVLAHSGNREKVYETLAKAYGKNVIIEYTGPSSEELTVMFLFS